MSTGRDVTICCRYVPGGGTVISEMATYHADGSITLAPREKATAYDGMLYYNASNTEPWTINGRSPPPGHCFDWYAGRGPHRIALCSRCGKRSALHRHDEIDGLLRILVLAGE